MNWKCPDCGDDNIELRCRCGRESPDDLFETQPGHEHVAWEGVLLTTTPYLSGFKVSKNLDIVTAECAFGMNIFRDIFANFSDALGGRSKATQKVLRDARKVCLNELRKEAYLLGANAVIGVDLDYSEFSGHAKSMLFLVASGTAVLVDKINREI